MIRKLNSPVRFVLFFVFLFAVSYSVALASDGITNQQLLERIEKNTAPLILDVRSPREFASGHVPGAINIPHKKISDRLAELTQYKDKEIAVYCEAGVRAAHTEGILHLSGFRKILHLEGDMRAWRTKGLPQE